MMSLLGMTEARLPVGFRFQPRDEELISDYLARRVSGDCSGFPKMMVDVDLTKCEPWDLPEMACVGGKVWYFYSLQDQKYASGKRANRSTAMGHWKATGKDRSVFDPRRGVLVGMKKTLVFYLGRANKGKKTGWIMHEFRMEGSAAGTTSATSTSSKDDWILCRVFHNNKGLPSGDTHDNAGSDTHDKAGPSSFPPPLDSVISSERPQLSTVVEGYGQLPCMSSNPPRPPWKPRPQSPSNTSLVSPAEVTRTETVNSFTHLGGVPDFASCLNPLCYERMAMSEFLDPASEFLW